MLSDIKIILVEPINPGNIGATARAMKTMGLSQLVLIRPKTFPHKDAYIRSTHATDILDNCLVTDNLSDVIKECQLVIGTSTRDRGGYVPALTTREATTKLIDEVSCSSVALVFGTESHGMTGEDLRLCHYYAYIPTNPDFSSLNLAAAVQIFCYELFQYHIQTHSLESNLSAKNVEEKSIEEKELISDLSLSSNMSEKNLVEQKKYPTDQQLSFFYQRFEETLNDTGFINQKHPGIVMQRIRAVFKRARLDEKELNIFQGITSSIKQKLLK